VYLQNLPEPRGAKLAFMLPSGEGGEALFKEKGCANCHKGGLALEYRLGDSTLTSLAASMWNNNPQMQQPHPQITLPEMRQPLGYLWSKQFFYTRGNPGRGQTVSESKKCATCHNDAASAAPALGQTLRALFGHHHGCHTLETRPQHARKDAVPAHPLATIFRERHGDPDRLFEFALVEARGAPG
jgi:cytochrome c551/c552